MSIRFLDRRTISVLSVVTVAAIAWYGRKTLADIPARSGSLAQQAISSSPSVSRSAINALRAQGPAGLQSLSQTFGSDIQQHIATSASPSAMDSARWQRIAAAMDGVARQKDSYASRLYWYTDMAQAKQAAKASGKPILSLRMLGHLDEEYSCANSRFFRTILYPNTQVGDYLRSHYILHWQSVRPVPTFTLDFGDGRKIVRTITGNSIHYVLDSQGRVVDAIPGLYGPQAFLRHLKTDETVAHKSASLANGPAQQEFVAQWHQDQFQQLSATWQEEGKKALRGKVPPLEQVIASVGVPRPTSAADPNALTAGNLAVSKVVVERPIVQAVSPANAWAMGAPALEWGWYQIAQLHAADAVLDANSKALMASKKPDLTRVPTLPGERFGSSWQGFSGEPIPAGAAPAVQSPMQKLVASFERSVAQDSIRNEYVFHAKIHQWLSGEGKSSDLVALNDRVYSDLFLTPNSDAWLGLAPAGVYTALQNDGLIESGPVGESGTRSIATR